MPRLLPLFFVLAIASASFARPGIAQIDALRRVRDAARSSATELDALFGKEPPLTTSIDDARDGVPSLDGFEPASYSPMADMPWGQDGTIILFPGTYSLVSVGYCLKPGTYGPQSGDGYLYTEWKGPKAELIKRILQRHPDNRDIPRVDVQMLLWAILTRADVSKLGPAAQAAA